ncbi:MAG: prolipoprotein diacylglyceryl transferase [Proteobacteria bacterium]|nr:prolipoprotein diacylglyceryl transferase [Cystobacterineae bacterium]MCL2259394.1 prolipoprotein diacylglyceryl transferase [Cystobacterineae bacterium]MCL2314185.1 prolipoprotein diacylglyceryl transferase [Pseudomonadota bacterium]
MLPVLYRLSGNTPASTVVVYVLALLLFLYALWTGWRACGPKGKVKGAARFWPLIRNGAIGLGAIGLGLWYILPEVPLLGKTKGAELPIPGYGVLVASAFLAAAIFSSQIAGWEWLGEEGKKRKAQVLDLMFYILVGAIVGARLLYILVNLGDYAKNPLSIFNLQGGLVFYGGLVGAVVASFYFAKKHSIPFLRLADIGMPAVSLGQCLGRLGCFAAACCHGRIVGEDAPFGVHFPGEQVKDLAGNLGQIPSVAFSTHARDMRWVDLATGKIGAVFEPGMVRISEWALQNDQSLAVHPTQLYEAAGQLLLFLFLLFMRSWRRFHGQIFGMWLICYALLRSTVELFRGDLERGTLYHLLHWMNMPGLAAEIPLEAWYNISTSQAISLGIAALGVWVLARGWQNRKAQLLPPILPPKAPAPPTHMPVSS